MRPVVEGSAVGGGGRAARWLSELRAGQRVKAKGAGGAGGILSAVEIELRPEKDHAVVEGVLEHVDLARRTISILGRRVTLDPALAVTDARGAAIPPDALRPRAVARLKGGFSETAGLVVRSARMRPARDFNIQKLEGTVDRVDRERGTLEVAGFTVLVTERTLVGGGS